MEIPFLCLMFSYISASYVYPVASAPIKNGVLAVEGDGRITGVFTAEEAEQKQIKDIKFYEGLLVPGFINTHCHLELSALSGQIAQHTGLPAFVQSVIKLRAGGSDDADEAMLKADAAMFEQGIVAVGDISNQLISKNIKCKSKIYYHTFLEVMGFNPDTANQVMERALQLRDAFKPLPVSIVPHAPYSVSEALFSKIKQELAAGNMQSIHSQETLAEHTFFIDKTGEFLELYQFLGLDISFYKPSGKSSLQTFLPLLATEARTLLVHNTFSSQEDVAFAKAIHPNLYWCLCPGANLYIEHTLPDVNMLRNQDIRITLGTDSLASNTKLSIFAEMLILQECLQVPVEELIQWATLNGAAFLGVTDRFGTLEPGKQPGINLLDYQLLEDGTVVLGNEMKRLF